MSSKGKWSDLGTRLGSAVVLMAVALGAIWAGGFYFALFVALASAGMIWELVRMLAPEKPALAMQLGALAGAALLLAVFLPPAYALPLLVAPAMVGLGQMPRHRLIFVMFSVFCLLAGFGLIAVRDDLGVRWLLWLVFVVIASDVGGYFAGKAFGGPKFWPRISPNKTWSGTIAGWVGAGLVGAVFAQMSGQGFAVVSVSIVMAFAAQMGDIAESAIKRRTGVKDSSNLIPGHGGLMDRFDGILGASVFLLLVLGTFGLGPGAGG